MEAGQDVYNKYCLICHQSNGSGVPGLNSPLIRTEYVLGDENRLLKIILNGSADGLELNNSEYANVMPSFRALSDEQIAEVGTYIRNSFGNNASPIDAQDVKEVRASIPN
nr:cytochrome c [Eudoraea chungangensis]